MADNRGKVLIVDDRLEWLVKCADLLTEQGYHVTPCRDARKALDVFRECRPDAVLLDIKMPGRGGLDILKEIRAADPWVAAIMLSGYGDSETVVRAMKLGADNFVEKSSDLRKVPLLIEKELHNKQLEIENIGLRGEQDGRVVLIKDIVGECPAIRQVKEDVRTYADSDTEALITGPTGVGKDHVAMALHYESRRRNEPFKNVSCPVYQETLIESALFGHERGAFTGAYRRKEGVIEAAGKGTVLLNEFVEIPRHVQAKFLVVLDSGVFSRLGEEGRDRRTHARFIGATNADLDEAKDSGALREDLLWRLKKIWIRIPPLKERGEDIILLAEHFIEKECRALGKPAFPLSQRSKDILMDYQWPGNVRQLGGFIGMLVQSGREEIEEPPRALAESASEEGDNGGPVNLKLKLKERKEDLERTEIEKALSEFRGSRKKAASHLGMSYRTLLYKMKRYGLRDKY